MRNDKPCVMLGLLFFCDVIEFTGFFWYNNGDSCYYIYLNDKEKEGAME